MATRNSVDNIVNDLNAHTSSQDFGHVAEQLVQLQQSDRAHFQDNLNQINQRVDMRRLGFSEDFQIVGVQEGKIVALSQDRSKVEFRDVHNMNNMQIANNVGDRQAIGANGREATVYPDGSADYKVGKNDNLWNIARDVLAERNTRPASQNEIGNFVNELAAANHMSNPGLIKPGDVVHVPAQVAQNPQNPLHPDAHPARSQPPSIEPGSYLQAPRDSVYNPVAPPGLAEGTRNEAWDSTRGDTASRRNVSSVVDNRTGNVTNQYEGQLANGFLGMFRTNYTANETTDPSGKLTHRRINYDGVGPSLDFKDANGNPISISHVRSVETQYNSATGRYRTEIVDANGNSYRATTNSDGRLASMGQFARTPQNPQPDWVYPPIY